ncbi:MAG: hypothetical protein M1821_009417 [Bathelium mastoideum]|nr:MAG: hypothetical protein M1821_009417 [Bathelium mastoideum]
MQSSRILAFKALSSKIHSQLPLNPRESQQLLTLLTNSFRRHLEKEHPHSLPNDTKAQEPQSGGNDVQGTTNTQFSPSSQASAQASAGNVMRNILLSPLFSKPDQPFSSLGARAFDLNKDETEFQKALKDPVDWFEHHVAQGILSTEVASAYLTIIRRMPDALEQEQAKYRDRAVTVFCNWLWTSGLDDSLSFVHNDSLTKNAVYLLVKSGYERKIWTWVDRLGAFGSGRPAKDVENKQTLLLVFLADARLALSGSMDNALQVLLDVMNRGKPPTAEPITRATPVGRLAHYLRKQIIHGNTPPKDEAVFEKFLQASLGLVKNVDFCYSQLMLVHPRGSDGMPAVSYMRQRLDSGVSPVALTKTAAGTKFILDTAQVLINQANYHDAAWVMSLAEGFLGEQRADAQPTLKGSAKPSSSPSKAEMGNLEVLGGWSPG